MDRSILRLPDPVAGPPHGERRRSVRQKLHTPVYASFNGPQTGLVVDLSELLDLNEEGFAVQTSERLEMNRAVTLCLDLPETKSYIHGSGEVMWSDDTGRAGIRFSGLPESSRKILKEWLFANLLVACSNHANRTEQLARRKAEELPELVPVTNADSVAPMPDESEMLSSVEAACREIREIGDDLYVDAFFQLITERALSLTGASGAALAFLTDNKMICRARAGEPAPPLGAAVDVTRGLSGECVRSGLLVSCEDTENDSRVDPEVCRTLGIGSLMAAPFVSELRVVGLLEIFSPHPRSFTQAHGAVLDRLVEIIPKTHRDKAESDETQPESTRPEKTQPETFGPEAMPGASQPSVSEPGSIKSGSMEPSPMHAIREALWDEKPEVPEQLSPPVPERIVSEQVPEPVPEPAPAVLSRLLHLALLGLVIVVIAIVVGYLVSPLMEKRNSPQVSQRSLVKEVEAASTLSGQSAPVKSLADLRTLADQGNAEAQFQMGVRYHNGEDVPQDDAQAMQWFLRAAEQGHVDAQSHLGAYYWAGRGVPEDLSQSYFWSTIAMAQGDENSKSRLEGLSSQMTRAQVSAARQQAEVWIHAHSQRAKSETN